jgi:hypothetical protein
MKHKRQVKSYLKKSLATTKNGRVPKNDLLNQDLTGWASPVRKIK